ncbi:MAG: hypothetical protein K0Q90_4174 [Paenibacillaceae bacterium]|jgi:hypothetical protein|nr:hypothetical protein [Paenibacillaceae bacterium]
MSTPAVNLGTDSLPPNKKIPLPGTGLFQESGIVFGVLDHPFSSG